MNKYYDSKEKRLVYINKRANNHYWDNFWSSFIIEDEIRKNQDNWTIGITKSYLPLNSKILEGGCGMGSYVNGFQKNGYKACGVDFANNTVKEVNRAAPDLDIKLGDVRNLDFADSEFDGYWSFGVIEHFYEGYDLIMKEMHRVLRKGGYLFLTFPCMSRLRKLNVRLNRYKLYDNKNSSSISSFYQFALDPQIVSEHFADNGFVEVQRKMLAGFKGFKDEIGILKPILQRINDSQSLPAKFSRLIFRKYLSELFGHSVLLIFKKGNA